MPSKTSLNRNIWVTGRRALSLASPEPLNPWQSTFLGYITRSDIAGWTAPRLSCALESASHRLNSRFQWQNVYASLWSVSTSTCDCTVTTFFGPGFWGTGDVRMLGARLQGEIAKCWDEEEEPQPPSHCQCCRDRDLSGPNTNAPAAKAIPLVTGPCDLELDIRKFLIKGRNASASQQMVPCTLTNNAQCQCDCYQIIVWSSGCCGRKVKVEDANCWLLKTRLLRWVHSRPYEETTHFIPHHN